MSIFASNLSETLNFKQMIVTKETFPKVFERLFENQQNYQKLTENLLDFNKKMFKEKNIKFAVIMTGDRIIIDDNVCDEFSELCEELGIDKKIPANFLNFNFIVYLGWADAVKCSPFLF